MYGEGHYLSKIERNCSVIDKAPQAIAQQCANNIMWARELSGKLPQLDYAEREQAIQKIHEVLDSDYENMGFTINDTLSKTR